MIERRLPGPRLPGLLVLVVLAGALRLVRLDAVPWYDEMVTLVEWVRLPLGAPLFGFESNNNHPLFSVLAQLSVAAFGESPWSLRLPAVLFGVATVPLMVGVGRAVGRELEGWWAAVLLAVSYHHVWFSQNARGYTALAFWTLLSTWLLVRTVSDGRRPVAVAYGAAVALGSWTHLTMVFVAIGQGLACAWLWTRGDPEYRLGNPSVVASGFLAAAGLTILLYLPMMPDLVRFYSEAPTGTSGVATPQWAVLEALRGLQVGLGSAGVAAAAVLGAAGLVAWWRDSPFLTGVFCLPVAVTAAAAVGLGWPVRPRFFFFAVGPAALLLVRGAAELARPIGARLAATGRRAAWSAEAVASALVFVMAAASVAALPALYELPKQDFEGARRFVLSQSVPPSRVFAAGLANYAYRDYYQDGWRVLERADQFDAALDGGGPYWIVYSFPEYIGDRGLAARLTGSCRTLRRFPGTLRGGDVVVCVAPGGEGDRR